ncbi:MAG TPA: DUF192 domain-containing protein [Acidobacteriaceae bacterium]|jgi:hypothetical protein|nr:DUF192 domain-containing protein [Acidobacteriaceae bacterium]
MRWKLWIPALCVAMFLPASGVQAQDKDLVVPPVPPRPANTLVMLPDGSTVHVELATTPAEQNYGLMGRSTLPEGRGMLFVHDGMSKHAYWMYHCKIGLDIVWMDSDRRIVEMSPDTPPCKGRSTTCPNYGGQEPSQYVIELPVGDIAKHHLAVGEQISFQISTQ